jgi:hypothetical protein
VGAFVLKVIGRGLLPPNSDQGRWSRRLAPSRLLQFGNTQELSLLEAIYKEMVELPQL